MRKSLTVLAGLVSAAVIVMFWRELPAMRRYLKIRSM